jgi:hypothetical protein
MQKNQSFEMEKVLFNSLYNKYMGHSKVKHIQKVNQRINYFFLKVNQKIKLMLEG